MSSFDTQRRRILTAAALLPTLLLAACGFRPRHYVGLAKHTLHFRFDRAAALEPLVPEMLVGTRAMVVADPKTADATVVLGPLEEAREIIALSPRGTVREYALRSVLTVRLVDRAGEERLPPTRLVAERDYSYDDSRIAARAEEEQVILTDMRRELLRRALLLVDRRLAAHP
ncbi:LPS assembly lipoprotein LptE [Hydrogenophilus thiooxidans]|uniref:LPS-assembly lipoprotein LptE n=1 Tax=Hydrogenophilus thiooxidans TaxID=2820326 RepID=UPI001C23BAB0|nr:LPS assembly lipoprotein LptE [Hydrogenophilus thiooxidans]